MNKKKVDSHNISIDELVSSSVSEIREDLSDSELNDVMGGIGEMKVVFNPFEGCRACTSGYDPRFDETASNFARV
jgi:hypothetical protein